VKMNKMKFFKFKKNTEENSYDFFKAVSDILYYSIRNRNENMAKTISDFMYGAFKEFRDKNAGIEVVYPIVFYEVVSKTIEELATQKNRRLTFLEHRTAGSVWLLGEFGNSKISETTYSWIWSNLLLALNYEKDDYVIYHWEQAFQYISRSLDHIAPLYSADYKTIKNKKEIDQRFADRKRFFEFHYALGGLLLYKRRYSCIKRAFTYTQSIPPKYELLPDTMTEIFGLYFNFIDPYGMNYPWISSRYYFPELGGLNSDGIIKRWICQYVGVLFIRQYSIVPHLITMKPLDPPIIPSTQGEKRQWIDNLDYFKILVEETLKNKELLITIGLDFVTEEWCEKYKYPKPLEFIEKIKQDVIASFEGTLIEQTISDVRRQKFKDTTIAVLSPIFNEYKIINNKTELLGELNKWYINGQSHIIDKSGFADNQDADYLNFDSFLPNSFSDKYRSAISEIFVSASSQYYLLNYQDILPAVTRLGINTKDYVIVSFGIDIKDLITKNNNEFLNDIEIIKFEHRNYHLVGDSLFILKKIDLPRFNYREIKAEEIEQYSLDKVIEEYNLYLTVIDLNQAVDLRKEFAEHRDEKDLRKSVYMAIFLNLEVQWKKNIQAIQIKQASAYQEGGIINNLGDVKPIDDK
jgi:hypothetical protein